VSGYILTAFLGVLLGAGIAIFSVYMGFHYGWWSAKGSNPGRLLREFRSGVPDA
jgi:hypothetical protein